MRSDGGPDAEGAGRHVRRRQRVRRAEGRVTAPMEGRTQKAKDVMLGGANGYRSGNRQDTKHPGLPALVVPEGCACPKCTSKFTRAMAATIRINHNKKHGTTNWQCVISCPKCRRQCSIKKRSPSTSSSMGSWRTCTTSRRTWKSAGSSRWLLQEGSPCGVRGVRALPAAGVRGWNDEAIDDDERVHSVGINDRRTTRVMSVEIKVKM